MLRPQLHTIAERRGFFGAPPIPVPDPLPAFTPEGFPTLVAGEQRCLGVKPAAGGFWTSTYDERYGSGWVQWCLMEDFQEAPFASFVLTPDPSARVLVIGGMEDLIAVVNQYGVNRWPEELRKRMARGDELGSRLREMWATRGDSDGVNRHDLVPDYSRVAEDFDAVSLTDAGQWDTRLPLDPHLPSLYGWDSESTLWLRWAFESVKYIGLKDWKRSDDEWTAPSIDFPQATPTH